MNDAERKQMKDLVWINQDILLNQWLIQIEVQYDSSSFEVCLMYQHINSLFHRPVWVSKADDRYLNKRVFFGYT